MKNDIHLKIIILSLLLLSISFISPSSLFAAQIRLAWDANTETDLAGYRLYFWKNTEQPYSHHIDVRKTATPAAPVYRQIGLAAGETYCFAATAYDNFGNESGYSNLPNDVCGLPAPTEYVNPFTDILPGYWAEDHILTIYYAYTPYPGITSGCESNRYCPDNYVSREQMAAFIVRAVEGDQSFEGQCAGPSPFADVPASSPFCKNIERLVGLGITQGCGPNLYCPSSSVPREQMAAFIIRAVEGVEPTLCTGAIFSDVTSSNPFCSHIERVADLGVAVGFADGTFRPANPITRAEMAAFITRAFIGIP